MSEREQEFKDRFLDKVMPEPNSGCWLWLASTRNGYGCFDIEGRHHRAHRVAYEMFVGLIPPGLFVLHDCDTPVCVNPKHLHLGTQTVNMQDMVGRGRHPNSRKTHCREGHPFDEKNTRWTSRGRRECKTCANASVRRRYWAKKEKLR